MVSVPFARERCGWPAFAGIWPWRPGGEDRGYQIGCLLRHGRHALFVGVGCGENLVDRAAGDHAPSIAARPASATPAADRSDLRPCRSASRAAPRRIGATAVTAGQCRSECSDPASEAPIPGRGSRYPCRSAMGAVTARGVHAGQERLPRGYRGNRLEVAGSGWRGCLQEPESRVSGLAAAGRGLPLPPLPRRSEACGAATSGRAAATCPDAVTCGNEISAWSDLRGSVNATFGRVGRDGGRQSGGDALAAAAGDSESP